MSKKYTENPDPFALFGNQDQNDNFDDDWDPFAETLQKFDDDSANSNEDPFVPVDFTQNELPVQHRRTISSPMRVLSPQPVYNNTVYHPPVCQLPLAMSTCDFHNQPRPFIIPRPPFNIPLRQTMCSEFTSDEAAFFAVRSDPTLNFNPLRLGLIPPNLWEDRNMTFGECVSEFFQRKNNANSRFSHKLFNALRLSEFNPIYTPFVGVKWLNENILRVDKRAFARLLGIKSIDGSLFHQQGNFPSHGFFEIGAGDVNRYCPPGLDLTGVDFENVRLLVHTENLFKRGCTEADIEHCRWASARKS
ncbi:hypothetical protein TRFO_17332 [Tritrichomonas foetus]|uniref:Initiator binding domain-containing protein n=1 Tax=Tritrichomonas foetus TaxID=1144522 RepID=A0A1J4KST3_9EUKA|nr:hypothetical protein TRFO_17332 [Tritrichomonas foetus]|eukprot:OHT12718.1 hypothetical protein TRFO_17332 [Tritrichomonas foetus]